MKPLIRLNNALTPALILFSLMIFAPLNSLASTQEPDLTQIREQLLQITAEQNMHFIAFEDAKERPDTSIPLYTQLEVSKRNEEILNKANRLDQEIQDFQKNANITHSKLADIEHNVKVLDQMHQNFVSKFCPFYLECQ